MLKNLQPYTRFYSDEQKNRFSPTGLTSRRWGNLGRRIIQAARRRSTRPEPRRATPNGAWRDEVCRRQFNTLSTVKRNRCFRPERRKPIGLVLIFGQYLWAIDGSQSVSEAPDETPILSLCPCPWYAWLGWHNWQNRTPIYQAQSSDHAPFPGPGVASVETTPLLFQNPWISNPLQRLYACHRQQKIPLPIHPVSLTFFRISNAHVPDFYFKSESWVRLCGWILFLRPLFEKSLIMQGFEGKCYFYFNRNTWKKNDFTILKKSSTWDEGALNDS